MTVGELRKALKGLPDNLEIVVRAWDDDNSDYCGTIDSAEVQHGCSDDPFFAIDCGPEDE